MELLNKKIIKQLLYATALLFMVSACKKHESPVMEDPDARLIQKLDENKEILVNAEHGWIGAIYPGAGGGYSFYIEFLENDRVRMVGDFNQESATELFESSYRMKALQRPTLIFDTYNHIHLLHDPDRNISGGDRGEGLLSDFEFAIVEANAEQVLLEGTFNDNPMVLRAATAGEKDAILDGAWANILQTTTDFVTDNQFVYLTLQSNQRISVEINIQNRQVTLSWLESDDSAQTITESFAFLENRLVFENPLQYKGINISELIYDPSEEQFNAIADGSPVMVRISQNPIIPLHTMFGHGDDLTMLHIEGEEMPAGVTSGFDAIYSETAALFQGTGRQILYTELSFIDDEQIRLLIRYQTISSGSQFSATATYEYGKNGNSLKLEQIANNNNWNTRSNQVRPMREYFENAEFLIDWVESTDPGSGALGALHPVNDPDVFFYGVLR